MEHIMTSKGIVFDMDGTLWDASEQVTAAWNLALAKKPDTAGIHVTVGQIQSLMGKTMTVIFDALIPSVGEQRRLEIADDCCREENNYLRSHGAKLYPRVAETLQALSRDYRLFIVSNCQDGYIEAFLSYYKLGGLIADTECFGRTGKNKGDNIRILAERNHLEHGVYVGDTQLDFESAQYAGMPFIHAAYGYGEVKDAAFSVSTFSELTETVPKIL